MDFTPSHPFHCSLRVQLRFSDLDTLGHVNNSVYLNLFDLGKSDYFERAAGQRQDWNNVNVVIANININFLHETRFHEKLQVLTQVDHVGNKSFTVLQALQNVDTGEIKCFCSQVMVYLDPLSRVPAPLPEHWRQAFATMEGRTMQQ